MRYSESVVVSHERCPKCQDIGRDRHGDNLAVYSDGHHYCFACGYRKASPNSLSNLRKKLDAIHTEASDTIHSIGSTRGLSTTRGQLPEKARSWLHKYGITESEYRRFGLFYESDRELLCFPITESNELVYYNGRYFGPEPKHSKYVAVGHKPTNPAILRTAQDSSVFIAVEDYVSAIKIARQYNAICLFGTKVSHIERLGLALSNEINSSRSDTCISPSRCVSFRLWLDFDKYREAIKQAARARQYIPDSATIVTPKDPKCYSDIEIKEIIESTFSETTE